MIYVEVSRLVRRTVVSAGLVLAIAILGACGPDGGFCLGSASACRDDGCDQGCPSGQRCLAGQCVASAYQCSQMGEVCDPAQPSSQGYLCIDWDAEGPGDAMCSRQCGPQRSCATGSSCFVLRSNRDSSCQDTDDCSDAMHCMNGTCRYAACQPVECSGVLAGQQTCAQKYADDPAFENGARCYEADGAANVCVPAGVRHDGEACETVDAAHEAQSFEATCAPGLGCVGGVCRRACGADQDCPTTNHCVVGTSADLADGVGVCTTTCTPFEPAACAGGQTCRPIAADTGTCVPSGHTSVFSACTPGAGECASGTVCVDYGVESTGSDASGRCQRICDVSAGPASADGTISADAQAARDATCPQPAPAGASIRLAHLAPDIGAVDVYVSQLYVGEQGAAQSGTPTASALAFGSARPTPAAGGWLEQEAGRYRVVAVEAGAPATDPPVARGRVDLASGVGKVVYLASTPPADAADATLASIAAVSAADRGPQTRVRVVNLVADVGAVDVVGVAAGADAADAAEQVVMAEGIEFGQAGALLSPPAADFRLLVFAEGAERTRPEDAAIDVSVDGIDADSELILRGTIDPNDIADASAVSVVAMAGPAPSRPRGPQYSCTAIEGTAYGYCQQVCAGGAADFGADTCRGPNMGCVATEFVRRDAWMTLCAPVGQAAPGDACDPSATHSQCQEGLYCRQYGTGARAGSASTLGRCKQLCAVGDSAGAALGCPADQSCQPLVYDGTYPIGHCGRPCTPGQDYGDPSCPAGLRTCYPKASLREDPSGQQAPLVRREQSFCGPSGPVEPGQPCRGLDCGAGSDCLYPRSAQSDLTTTILSPYYGSSGQAPTCKPACDPFDHDAAARRCGDGQTCLPNFPFNAEVGHCDPIAEYVSPMQPCTKPGLSCGPDSICAVNQGENLCLRLCDYAGADAQGAFLQSTCASNRVCQPFVADIGLCRAPVP